MYARILPIVVGATLLISDLSLAAPYVRKNASTQAAQADLLALDVALKKMRDMGCEDPRSWYYQGATHAIPATIPNGDNPLCPSYTNISELKWGWNTCTHQEGSEIHFLLWHRLYIQHFEAIVRELSGKADFALPYWDYTNPANRVMPAALRHPQSSLFSAERLPSLNEGNPISNTPSANMDKLLNVDILFQNRVFKIFNSDIDRAPHGSMHNYVGGAYNNLTMWNSIYRDKTHPGLMSEVPSAGFDPVFWLHHANIDYLWQKWERSSKGSRPSLPEMQAVPWPYQFIDAQGKQIQYTVEEAYNAAFSPNYIYDQLGSPVASLQSQRSDQLLLKNSEHIEQQIWQVKPGKLVDNKTIDIDLPRHPPQLLGASSAAANALVLQLDLSFSAEPRDAYEVLLTDSQGKEQLAGYLTFFGAAHHAQAHASHEHAGHDSGKLSGTYYFDVSDELTTDEPYGLRIRSQGQRTQEISIESVKLLRY